MVFSQSLNTHRILKRLAKALIRLRVCAGWSEPLLVAHTTLLEISCTGIHIITYENTLSKSSNRSLLLKGRPLFLILQKMYERYNLEILHMLLLDTNSSIQ